MFEVELFIIQANWNSACLMIKTRQTHTTQGNSEQLQAPPQKTNSDSPMLTKRQKVLWRPSFRFLLTLAHRPSTLPAPAYWTGFFEGVLVGLKQNLSIAMLEQPTIKREGFHGFECLPMSPGVTSPCSWTVPIHPSNDEGHSDLAVVWSGLVYYCFEIVHI